MTHKGSTNRADRVATSLIAIAIGAVALTVPAGQAVAAAPTFDATQCSLGQEICKRVVTSDLITLGEQIGYRFLITVFNTTGSTWTAVSVTDTFGSDLDYNGSSPTPPYLSQSATKGSGIGTKKWKLNYVHDLPVLDGGGFLLRVDMATDVNPGGNQEYTACGPHVLNGGANLKFRNSAGKWQSFNTGAILIDVPCPSLP